MNSTLITSFQLSVSVSSNEEVVLVVMHSLGRKHCGMEKTGCRPGLEPRPLGPEYYILVQNNRYDSSIFHL